MAITRRDLLRSAGLLAGGSVLAADSPAGARADSSALPPLLVDLTDYERLAPDRM